MRNDVAMRLLLLRKRANLTQEELASRCRSIDPLHKGFVRATYISWESGRVVLPARAALLIAQVLGVNPSDLLYGEQEVPKVLKIGHAVLKHKDLPSVRVALRILGFENV